MLGRRGGRARGRDLTEEKVYPVSGEFDDHEYSPGGSGI